MLRVGAATMAHAEKDGGKAKTTPGKRHTENWKPKSRARGIMLWF